ncbi:ATP-binding protein [Pseudarthrobacter sp. NS4]|uniref:ATP-binding protein n=1 Tax=Pseudarthrobacter sp. NS4 TaxID=2973976 RepID=UPI0037C709D6
MLRRRRRRLLPHRGSLLQEWSLAISSNMHPSGFDELMPKTIATATVDRLLHHAHLCQTSGESVRLMQAQNEKGTRPMS